MAYTYSPTTDRGKVRMLIRDVTNESGPTIGVDYIFSDASIDALLDLNDDDVWLAAADGCRARAGEKSDGAIAIDLSGLKVDLKKPPEYWLRLAQVYEKRSAGDVSEYVDSYLHQVSFAGEDESEYVGDLV
ncbi:MAG: hypothetical protein ACXABY_37100 [Candidatus Thorarchaeota archaeon]